MSEPEDNQNERLLHEKSLAFFGAITASVSHELNNVVSIIQQTSGLLEDLLYSSQDGQPIGNEKLQRIVDGVSQQTSRGVGIIGRFNYFAHTVDNPVQEYELNKTLDNLIGLCGRFADMKRVKLETALSGQDIPVNGSPFNVQQIVFLYLKRMLAVAQRDDIILVSSQMDGSDVHIRVEGPSGVPEDGFDDAFSGQLVDRVKGSISLADRENRLVVELVLPAT
jgi:C4-dicarboxylate-specific signal transduction histidine kinase